MNEDRANRYKPANAASATVLTEQEWANLATALCLSPRELQIVGCVFDDLKDGAIAERLRISTHTVRTHFERLYRKLEVSSRSALVVRVFMECISLVRTGQPFSRCNTGSAEIEVIKRRSRVRR